MPPPAQQRELRYNVVLAADTRPAEQAFQRVAQNVDQIAKKAQQLAAGGGQVGGWPQPPAYYTIPAPPGQPGGGGDGGGGGGKGKGKDDDKLGTAAMLAKVAFWTQAVGNLATAVGGLSNEATGARQKVLDLAGSVPFIGNAVESILAGAFDLIERVRTDANGGYGSYDARQKRIRDLPFDAAREAATFQRDAARSDLRAADEVTMENARLGVFAAADTNRLRFAPDDTRLNPNRGLGTLFGGVSFGEGRFDSNKEYDAIIRQARIGVIGARQGRDSAQGAVNATARQLQEQEGKYALAQERSENAMVKARAAADKASGDPTRQGELQEALLTADKERTAAAREAARLEEQIKRSKEQQLQLARSEQELRKANIGVSQAELQVVNAKLAKAEGGAEQFGAFDPAKQQAVLRAVQQAKGEGFEGLSPEQKQLLLGTSATGDFARGLAKQAGDNDVYRQVQAEVGDQDIKTLKGEKERLQAKINADIEIDADKLKAEVGKKLTEGIGQVLEEAIDKGFRLKLQEIELKYLGQKAANK